MSPVKKENVELGQGLLDISVELSTPNLIAGNEFSIYVLLKNPYRLPIWIQNVTVSIPSEIELPQWLDIKAKAEKAQTEIVEKAASQGKESDIEKKERQILIQDIAERRTKIRSLQGDLEELRKKIKRTKDEQTKSQLEKKANYLEIEIEKLDVIATNNSDELRLKHKKSKASLTFEEKAELDVLEVGNYSFTDISFNKGANIGELRLGFTPGTLGSREVNLESSLPPNCPLQPGDTAVYTIILRTKSNILFRPSQYRLHFNVAYRSGKQAKTRVNTAVANLAIRASISAIMAGALIGGFAGFVAGYISRQLSSQAPFGDFWSLSTVFAFLLSLILSCVSVVFVARKSETQSLISVEDFWGGVLSGFLVGYSGVTAFQAITGIEL